MSHLLTLDVVVLLDLVDPIAMLYKFKMRHLEKDLEMVTHVGRT